MAVRRSRKAGVAAVAVIVIIVAALAFFKSKHLQFPGPGISGCVVHGRHFDVPLEPSQARIAATIAGVATHRHLPVRADTIAYAAALQESDLANLGYGDRDSVGVFQQRPSQGWGTRRELLDPAYASAQFFAALVRIPHYGKLRVYKAAQDVQHSADGTAYAQYEPQGALMADGFSGSKPRAVWCWYGSPIKGKGRLSAAEHQLKHAFGHLSFRRVGDPGDQVLVGTPAVGWAVAAWLVSHAGKFHLKHVSYQGYVWSAAHGHRGWQRDHGRHATAARAGLQFG